MLIPEIEKSIFCIVDVQEKFVPAMSEMSETAERIKVMINAMNELKVPIIVTEQYPKGLGATIPELKELLPQETPYLEKTCFSCMGSEAFRVELGRGEKKYLILSGIESHICVFQTAVEAAQHGYEVFLISDAVTSRRISDKETALDMLRNIPGINVVSSETMIFLLLKDASHPSFRAISKIIR